MVRHMRQFALLLIASSTAADLKGQVAKLEETKSACSACSILATKLDDVIQDAKLIKGWTSWSRAQRVTELRKVLRRACPAISDLTIYASKSAMGGHVYVDMTEVMKQNNEAASQMLADMDKSAHHREAVRGFCDEVVRDKETMQTIADRMEAFRLANGIQRPPRAPKRRLVDYRFKDDDLCPSVLGVCQADVKRRKDKKKAATDADERDL